MQLEVNILRKVIYASIILIDHLPHPVSPFTLLVTYQFPNSSFTFRSHLALQTVRNISQT